MNKIKIMPDDLANKIAAGEVVENVMSVVKELVENAIDAKATKIDITLIEEGSQLIQVIDNGEGMSKEDILNSVKRHATSKLLVEYDLFNINTLGFRGEALASIQSISKLKISSNNGIDGYEVDFSQEQPLVNQGYSNKGTKVSVHNLFYNVPARLKYLKSQSSELAKVVDFISKVSLANPHISFNLINNNKPLLKTNGDNDILKVAFNVYGLEVVKNLEEVSVNSNDFKIEGYLSNDKVSRNNKRAINIFVNDRLIYNNNIIKAICDAYSNYLVEKRYPFVILKITCDPKIIDVNVHPAKLEIRIAQEEQLINLIKEMIRNNFKIAEKKFVRKKEEFVQPRFNFDNTNNAFNYPNTSKVIKNVEEEMDTLVKEETRDYLIEDDNKSISLNKIEDIEIDKNKELTKINEDIIVEKEVVKKNNINLEDLSITEIVEEEVVDEYIEFDVIGQFDSTYILAQSINGFHIIDQHAAMERINYEKILNNFNNDKNDKIELLTPIIVNLTFAEKIKLQENQFALDELNLEIEFQSNNDILVRSIPSWIDNNNVQTIIENIIEYLVGNKKIKKDTFKKEELISISCKNSLKANHYLTLNEMKHLVNELVRTSNYMHCPHGRPIIITFSKYDIEKMFKRII